MDPSLDPNLDPSPRSGFEPRSESGSDPDVDLDPVSGHDRIPTRMQSAFSATTEPLVVELALNCDTRRHRHRRTDRQTDRQTKGQ